MANFVTFCRLFSYTGSRTRPSAQRGISIRTEHRLFVERYEWLACPTVKPARTFRSRNSPTFFSFDFLHAAHCGSATIVPHALETLHATTLALNHGRRLTIDAQLCQGVLHLNGHRNFSLALVRSQIADALSARLTQLPRVDVELTANHLLSQLSHALADGRRIEVRGFGSFFLRHRPARRTRNPKAGVAVFVSGKEMPAFKAGKKLRERVNNFDLSPTLRPFDLSQCSTE